MKKLALIIGLLALAAGSAIHFELIEFKQQRTLAKIGTAEISFTDKTKPDQTIGYVLLGIGIVSLIVAASLKK